MSASMITSVVFTGIGVVLLGGFIVIFNKLIRHKNYCYNAFAQIDVQLTYRYDLVPNLVAVAKEYLRHEQSVLQSVTEARNRAFQTLKDARHAVGEVDAMRDMAVADTSLTHALAGLRATVEAYPDLKADKQMEKLSEELVHIENRIAFARQAYNDEVMHYRITQETFPNNIVNAIGRFPTMAELDLEYDKEAPTLDL